MKRKGFTLVELLGVIIIIAILIIIVIPSIVNYVKKTSNETSELQKKLVYNATDLFVEKHRNDFPKERGNTYCIPLTQLISTDYLKKDMLNIDELDPSKKTVKIVVTNKYNYEIVDNDKCQSTVDVPTDSDCFATTEKSDGTLTINDYTCSYTDVVIPETINGKQVTEIGYRAFQNKKLTSVNIPKSVTSIGSAAFSCNEIPEEKAYIYNRNADGSINYSSLNSYGGSDDSNKRIIPSVIEGEKLTHIGTEAFSGCWLYGEVIIPDGVTHISKDAFSDNYLINVEIPDSVISIGDSAFTRNSLEGDNKFIYNRKGDGSIDYSSLNSYAGSNQGNIVIPSEVNGIKLTYIGPSAFNGTWIEGVTIPESVTHIGSNAFRRNRMTTITIPESVTHIGSYAFYNGGSTVKSLTSVIIKGKSSPSDFTQYGSSLWDWATGYSDSNIIWEG